jgi:hypothetical protein
VAAYRDRALTSRACRALAHRLATRTSFGSCTDRPATSSGGPTKASPGRRSDARIGRNGCGRFGASSVEDAAMCPRVSGVRARHCRGHGRGRRQRPETSEISPRSPRSWSAAEWSSLVGSRTSMATTSLAPRRSSSSAPKPPIVPTPDNALPATDGGHGRRRAVARTSQPPGVRTPGETSIVSHQSRSATRSRALSASAWSSTHQR